MRADALQRKRRILLEARRLFAERDSSVSLDIIAEASSVGIATLYRNFASRDELIVAVTIDILSDIEQVLAEALLTIDRSPRQAWHQLVHRLVELNLGAITDALGGLSPRFPAEVRAAQRAAHERFEVTLRDLARCGAVRGDLTAIEVIVAVGILTRPQPESIQRATPALVGHLIDAFLEWSSPPPEMATPLDRQ